MIKDDLSIFDTNKTWYFNWKSESRTSFPSLVGIDIDDKSKEIIEAVASVGLITDKQLFYFYKVRKKRSEEHTSELQSRFDLVCRLLLEKKKNKKVRSQKNKSRNT